MSSLKELYQEVILDHNRRPRNFRILEGGGVQAAEGDNPLCGDKISVALRLEGARVREIAFQGAGCAISQASASLMTEAVEGKTLTEVRDLFHTFIHAMKGEEPNSDLGKLEAFRGVRDYPMRVKCATLAWHTLNAALEGGQDPITTEA